MYPPAPQFRRSSFCGPGNCVEVGVLTDGHVAVRDSKRPDLGVKVFTPAEWNAFVTEVKAGEFDVRSE